METLTIVGSVIVAIMTGIGTLYGVWLKGRQDKQKDAVTVLTGHILRLEGEVTSSQRQIAQKQDFIDELYDLHTECELDAENLYGWIERANDRLIAQSGPGDVPLELPPRRKRSTLKRASYLRERADFNTALSGETIRRVLSNSPVTGESAIRESDHEEDPRRR